MNDDQHILSRLSGENASQDSSEEGRRIPVRVDADPKATGTNALSRAEDEAQSGLATAESYTQTYYGTKDDTKTLREKAEHLAESGGGILQFASENWRPRSYTVTGLTEDERLWAAITHLSSVLTLSAAIATDGWAIPLMVFIPLGIYFIFREKSDFVTFHALQAFAMQIVGTVGWIALLAVGASALGAGIALSALASIVLVGIPFLIVLVIALVLFVLACVTLPLVLVILSLVGAYKTYTGKDYRYPFISLWIERQLSGGIISA